MLQKIFSFFIKSNLLRKRKGRKSRAQSLVEVAIAFPLLLMLFSGMVEFGFMLNTYLSLLDATRQAARQYANTNPFTSIDDTVTPSVVVDDPLFYTGISTDIQDILAPPTDPRARRIVLKPSRDDIVITVLRIRVNTTTNQVASINRYPQPNGYWTLNTKQLSGFADDNQLKDKMTMNGASPVRTGMLIVEIYYGYEGVLQLPWVWAFIPGNYIMLHADTIMPLVVAKPPRIPTPTP
jgi:hypothetical protein